LGTDTNGPGAGGYHHSFSFEHSSKNGGGDLTQFAIPYASTAGTGTLWMRGRYQGSWGTWRAIAMQDWADGRFVSLTGSYSNPSWLTSLAAEKISSGTFSGTYTFSGTVAYTGVSDVDEAAGVLVTDGLRTV